MTRRRSQRRRKARPSTSRWRGGMGQALQEMWDSLGTDGLGLALFLVGGGLTLHWMVEGADGWLVRFLGWAALPVALALALVGLVLLLGERAGYWNPEALVGGELVVVGGLAAIHLIGPHFGGPLPRGAPEGVLGWGLGSLLAFGLGRWPGLVVAAAVAGLGLALLVRHTPLVYLLPWVQALVDAVRHRPGAVDSREAGAPLPAAHPPEEEPHRADGEQVPADEAPAPPPKPERPPARKPRRRPKQPREPRPLLREAEALPPLDLLDPDAGRYGSRDVEAMAELIQQTLADFDVPVEMVNVESGPTVTQFGVKPLYVERGGQLRKIRVSRIVRLADDLALALAVPSVRIEAPVPGRPYVGIEVPNPDKTLVGMRGILESPAMKRRGGMLPLALGRDTGGAPVVMDLTRAPHLLIAGATGSGKSVCINALIVSLLMHHGPESLRLIMVDPKMVELPGYNGIPHLIGNVVTDVDEVPGALTWLLLQMDDRYRLFREVGVRDIVRYNALARDRDGMAPLPYLVLVVDELADLMMTAPEEIERQLVRLAQMSRAVGIHLVLATQRPSTDVVTGLIKANFPTRIAFAVTSQVDSRVILDTPGAEKLLGQGDMLLLRPDASKLLRVQGAYVSDVEIERVVRWWKERDREEHPEGPAVRVAPWLGLLERMDDEDELLQEALDLIRGMETCTTSYLQRKLRIGYPRAARLMERLEAQGYVGPPLPGGQGRPVQVSAGEDAQEDAGWEHDGL